MLSHSVDFPPAEITLENVSKAQGMGGKALAFLEESRLAGWEWPGMGLVWSTAGCPSPRRT